MEITDPLETPWNGFTREDCDSFHGDEVEHVVTWQGQPAVNGIMGYTRLRFYMKDTQLYSFRVADA